MGVHYFVATIKVICHTCRRPLGPIKAQSEILFPSAPFDQYSSINLAGERKSCQSVAAARTLFISFQISTGGSRRPCF